MPSVSPRTASISPSTLAFAIPQTRDGIITEVAQDCGEGCLIQCEFTIPGGLESYFGDDNCSIRFTARSRIARLGIDLVPVGGVTSAGDTAKMTLRVVPLMKGSAVAQLLPRVLLPGIPVGRLVACPPSQRLSANEIYEAYLQQEFQLPASFSIDSRDRFTIQPHRMIYRISAELTEEMLLAILLREEGKAILNRIQVPVPVKNIIVEPGNGVITSCTMYLHRHFVVLAPEHTSLGQHTHAMVLDPVTTRGRQVFLEIMNHTSTPIINPMVSAEVYRALPRDTMPGDAESKDRNAAASPAPRRVQGSISAPISDRPLTYEAIAAWYSELPETERVYRHRPVALLDSGSLTPLPALQCDKLQMQPTRSGLTWYQTNEQAGESASGRVARLGGSFSGSAKRVATCILNELSPGTEATLLLRFFPNLIEHSDILVAMQEKRIRRVVFENASFEHGPYLSARDHSRLADYRDLGGEVFWCNRDRRHLARHVYRGYRGFFCEQAHIRQLETALIAACYGSSSLLSDVELDRLRRLIVSLKAFFGPDLALLTGGGPGVMKHTADIARDLKLLVGANYLEIESQAGYQVADFYQVFQETSRHMRQRWFEISSFAIFCIGGLGTLEEVGMTLTDIKLGITEKMPVVFFGENSRQSLYWHSLVEQLRDFADEGRGPDWIHRQILVTSDPAEVISFYQRVLEIG
ncbi:MAG: LOG family protein [Planctomyces sp.]|nr:LOG family protein [Planctomyces sp.]